MSFFLVEFLGKHQFTWVREADIIENFDPEDDPNSSSSTSKSSKKKRSLRAMGSTTVNSPLFATSVKEGQWALEEFEMQVRDPCGDISASDDDDDDDDDPKYSYALLCKSDGADEDATDTDNDAAPVDANDEAKATDEEAEELFSSEGLLDLSVNGRKKAKQRAAGMRRKREMAAKKAKAEKNKKDKILASKARKKQATKEKSEAVRSETKERNQG
mmetsp:Transcript_18924/g.27688  ORF Transcript_18924/g.27688 Transcript_18924/m.27688 type:complete len:216 (-) Transcript_18924:1201-1848(-)